jgi:hypothetical protein
MTIQWRSWRIAGGFLLSGLLAFAAPAPNVQPGPGAVNYVEGLVNLNGKPIDNSSVGNAMLQSGETLATLNGKAEVLLMPGVFLRLGEDTQVRMLMAGFVDVEVALDRGQATIEADYFPKENHLKVVGTMAVTDILKKGLYVLNPEPPFVQVLKGKAAVEFNGQRATAGESEQVVETPAGKLKAQYFNEKPVDDSSLVRWSRLRSQYEAQANIDAARAAVAENGWYGPGWYWGPEWGFWSYLPGDGMLYSPFGFGFYSPFYLGFYGGPYLYGRGFHGPSVYGARGFSGPRGGGFAVHGGFGRR